MNIGKIFPFIASLFILEACSNIDCPLDNIVEMTCGLYSADKKTPFTLTDTLTITPLHSDSILLNKAQNIKTFVLPLSYAGNVDTLLFHFSNAEGQSATDTIWIEKTNQKHFESADCPLSIFHTLQTVRWSSHNISVMPVTIDSVSLVRPIVNYENIENLRIFLRTAQ